MDESRIARLFPIEVAVCVADGAMYRESPHPEEATAVAGAVAKRRAEFAAGRAAARRALTRLGGPAVPLPRSERRGPVWPRGFIGSIAHCAGFCAAVVAATGAARSLGFDAEIGTPLDDELTPIVCSPEEMADCSHLPSPVTGDWPKLAFSAKESIYKCVDPVRREFLDFLDVRVRFGIDASRSHGTFEVAPLRSGLILPVIGRWAVDAERVYAGACWPHH